MKDFSILPEGLSEETLGAYLEGSLDIDQEIDVELMLDQWDQLQGFVNELADDYAAGAPAVDPVELPLESEFHLPYVSGLDELITIDDDLLEPVADFDCWSPDDELLAINTSDDAPDSIDGFGSDSSDLDADTPPTDDADIFE